MPTARLNKPVRKEAAAAGCPQHLVRRAERRRERRDGKRQCVSWDESKWPAPVHMRD